MSSTEMFIRRWMEAGWSGRTLVPTLSEDARSITLEPADPSPPPLPCWSCEAPAGHMHAMDCERRTR